MRSATSGIYSGIRSDLRLQRWWTETMEGLWHKNTIVYTIDLAVFRGRKRRRHRRFSRAFGKTGLPGRTECELHLASALFSVAMPRPWIRYQRLLQRRSTLRDAGRIRRVLSGRARKRNPHHRGPGGQSYFDRPSVVSGGPPGQEVEIPQLVRMVKREASQCGARHGIPGGAENDLDV